MAKALSDISRTNQLRFTSSYSKIAEQLYQYLFRLGKGIESFNIKNLFTDEEKVQPNFYEKVRPNRIKQEVHKRLLKYDKDVKITEVLYSIAYSNGGSIVYFLSPNKMHSEWKALFEKKENTTTRAKIINLIFKVHLLSESLLPKEIKTINGFEELVFVNSTHPADSKDEKNEDIYVWGQNLILNFNKHDTITIYLKRKLRLFRPKANFKTVDGEEMGELLIHEEKDYRLARGIDSRKSNPICFMIFPDSATDYEEFQKCQIYYHNLLKNKLEQFLRNNDIAFDEIFFQTQYFLENRYIKSIDRVESLEIINNLGENLKEPEKTFLSQLFKHYGISKLSFYNQGKTISKYEKKVIEEKEGWSIEEVVPWSEVKLSLKENYLVLNKFLKKDAGSMAYFSENDNLWYPSTKIESKRKVDFYSQLKSNYNFLKTSKFFNIQGINLPSFLSVKKYRTHKETTACFVHKYSLKKLKEGVIPLNDFVKDYTGGKLLNDEDAIFSYLAGQQDTVKWFKFCEDYKVKLSSEYQRVLLEIGIKRILKNCLSDKNYGFPIETKSNINDKEFYTIYVRSPKGKATKIVAVKFLFKDSNFHILEVLKDEQEIKRKFPFLRTRLNSTKLKNDQQYYVDDNAYISCYTDDYYTPTLIGRHGIIEEMENDTLRISRGTKADNSPRLFPLVSYYNSEEKTHNEIQKRICLDKSNKYFLQYFIPPALALDRKVKTGFKVYHLIGCKDYNGRKKVLTTEELINHPLTALHFNTLTHNVLRISKNSTTSLLQKITKILIEN